MDRCKRIETEKRLPFVLPYCPYSRRVQNFRKHWSMLKDNYPQILEMWNVPIPSYRKGRTTYSRLVKSDQYRHKTNFARTFLRPSNNGSYPCLSCSQCSSMINEKCFNNPHSGINIEIQEYHTCQSSFVIYIIKCPCGLLYLGETQTLKDRIARHKYSIRDKLTQLPLAKHFVKIKHTVAQHRFMVIDAVPHNRQGGIWELNLQKCEVQWIQCLDTLQPKRLNSDFDLHLFL